MADKLTNTFTKWIVRDCRWMEVGEDNSLTQHLKATVNVI